MPDVFLSYARADQQRVETVAALLEEAGYSLWWDRHITGGHRYAKDIETALAEAKAVVVFWSEAARESEWVLDEAAYARDENKLVPVHLDGVRPPLGYGQRQGIDLGAGSRDEDALHSLSTTIDELVGGQPHHIAYRSKPRRLIGKLAVLGAVALCVAIGFAAFWWAQQDDPLVEEAEIAAKNEDARSVAVLPFHVVSLEEDDRLLADALAILILERLDSLRELTVAPRTAAFRYRDSEEPLDAIASDLGVDHLLEGEVVRDGNRFSISARLVDARDGRALWSSSYQAAPSELSDTRAQIAEEVATALDVLLDETKQARMAAAGTDDPLAFAQFLAVQEFDQQVHTQGIGAIYEASQRYEALFDANPTMWRAAYAAADVYSHIMLASASGARKAGDAAHVWDDAAAHYQRLLVAARNATRRPSDRAIVEHARLIFSDDWSDIGNNARQIFREADDCSWPIYAQFPLGFGVEEDAFEYFMAKRYCIQGEPEMFLDLAAYGFYLDRHDEVARLADALAAEGTIEPRMLDEIRVSRSLYRNETDEALRVAEQTGMGPMQELYLALIRGDKDAEPVAEMPSVPFFGPDYLAILARGGHQEDLARLAAEIDARPAGPTVLHMAHTQCNCGPLFDLSLTPNYAARLREAGAEWPLRTGVSWPLKDW